MIIRPYFVDILENLKVAIEVIEPAKNHRAQKAVAGLRLAAEQSAALVAALRPFLKKCEYPIDTRAENGLMQTKECGSVAVYAHFGYEGEQWWYCEHHGKDKRFTRKVGDVEIQPDHVAAVKAILDAGASL